MGESPFNAPAPSVMEASVLAQQLGELFGNVLGLQVLPRADVLILGGDLAYPNPSNEDLRDPLVQASILAVSIASVHSACRSCCTGA